ncbi:MAG TPA: ribonuclease HI [Candidatus Acidoferrales bacterium]|nr:ribonuclease HI [Candidatus Acidoferrales bacterium]
MNAAKPEEPAGQVTIYTDGACRGNPGPGGWGAVLIYGAHRKELSGSAPKTTNNRMELTAAIEALSALKRPCTVELFTDSEYLKKGIQSWLARWKKRGFRTVEGGPVKNQDLWVKLDELASRHKVHWHWVRGHAGNALNELCDYLARKALEKGLGKQTSPDSPARQGSGA